MKLSIPVIAKVLACLSLFVGLSQPAAAARGNALLGVYYGNQGWNMTQVQDMESWQGKKHAVVNLFTNWCNDTANITMNNLFTQQLPHIWNNQNVPMITWEPTLGNPNDPKPCNALITPDDIEVQAVTRTYDVYFNAWATGLKDFLAGPDLKYNTPDDRRVYLRLAHEMNGDWYKWSAAVGKNKPANYVAMWQHIKGIFDRYGLDANHVQWVWSVNNTDVGVFRAEHYYPGDSYVDWVAIDGYNWGDANWKTPTQVFDPMVDRLRILAPTKPLAITEVGCTTAGSTVAAKAQWITDLFTKVVNNNVKMVTWFNEDKELDWAAFGGANGDGTFYYTATNAYTNTYSTYQIAVASNRFVSSDGTNLRLLTDAQFKGQ